MSYGQRRKVTGGLAGGALVLLVVALLTGVDELGVAGGLATLGGAVLVVAGLYHFTVGRSGRLSAALAPAVGVALLALGMLALADASIFRSLASEPPHTAEARPASSGEITGTESQDQVMDDKRALKYGAAMGGGADPPLAAGATEERHPHGPVAVGDLPRTGPAVRPGVLLAGLAFALGGWLIVVGTPRPVPAKRRL